MAIRLYILGTSAIANPYRIHNFSFLSMARSLQQIEQDLATLSDRVDVLAEELEAGYRQYLEQLTPSLKRNLVLASYQICTHVYPQAFLALSFSQRQKLQQQIQELAQETIAKFEAIAAGGDIAKILATKKEARNSPPARLLRAIKQRDRTVQQHLQMTAGRANSLLREAEILPTPPSPKNLEVALENEEGAIALEDLPELIQSSVEAAEIRGKPEVMAVAAIELPLSELEFNDPAVGAERQKIRQSLAQLQQVAKQYQQHERELARAQAELAWRASWYEE